MLNSFVASWDEKKISESLRGIESVTSTLQVGCPTPEVQRSGGELGGHAIYLVHDILCGMRPA